LGNDERSGPPKTATTDNNIAKVHQIVLENSIAEAMNMSKKRVCHILNKDRHERAVHALGATFAHIRPKSCLNEHFQLVSAILTR